MERTQMETTQMEKTQMEMKNLDINYLSQSQEQVLKQKQIWTGHRNNFKTENKFGPVTGTTLITSDKFEPVTRTNF
jgi:hypothetical protein